MAFVEPALQGVNGDDPETGPETGPERALIRQWVAVAEDRALAAADRTMAAEDRRQAAAERREAVALLTAARADELTGVLSRRAGRQRLGSEIDRARRSNGLLTVLFVDVDGLKRVNDERGHRQGDHVLAETARALVVGTRSYDLVMRHGGDEFVCVLPGADQVGADQVVERSRAELATTLPDASFSVGQARLLDGETVDDLLERADRDLYRRRRESTAT